LVEAGKLAQLFREVVVKLREALLLDPVDLYGIDESLAGEALVGDVFGITYVKGFFVPGCRPRSGSELNSGTVFLPPISIRTSSI
jgi:hypothetical protein